MQERNLGALLAISVARTSTIERIRTVFYEFNTGLLMVPEALDLLERESNRLALPVPARRVWAMPLIDAAWRIEMAGMEIDDPEIDRNRVYDLMCGLMHDRRCVELFLNANPVDHIDPMCGLRIRPRLHDGHVRVWEEEQSYEYQF